jgi:hypothetical protein
MSEATDQEMRAAVERWARATDRWGVDCGWTKDKPFVLIDGRDHVGLGSSLPICVRMGPLISDGRWCIGDHAALVWALVLEARPLRDGSSCKRCDGCGRTRPAEMALERAMSLPDGGLSIPVKSWKPARDPSDRFSGRCSACEGTGLADMTDTYAQHVLDSQPRVADAGLGFSLPPFTIPLSNGSTATIGPSVTPGNPTSIEALHVLADRLQPDLLRRADGPPRDIDREALGLRIAHLLAGSRDGTGEAVEALLRTLPELTCPTCDGAKLGRCCSCDVAISPIEQELAPNPYASDVHGDSSPHIMCDRCAYQSAQDI